MGNFKGEGNLGLVGNFDIESYIPALSSKKNKGGLNNFLLADLNADQSSDLVVYVSSQREIHVYLNEKGAFRLTDRIYNSISNPKEIVVADYNDDGKLDLIVLNNQGAVTLVEGTGPGTFTNPWNFSSRPMLRTGKNAKCGRH